MWQSAELHSTETYPKPSKRVKGSTGECRNSRTSSCIFWTLFSHFSQYNLCFYFRFLLLLESLKQFLRIGCVLMWLYWVAAPGIHPPTKPPNMFQPWGRMRKVSWYLPKTKQNYTERAPGIGSIVINRMISPTIQGATAKDIFWLVSTTWISQLKLFSAVKSHIATQTW